MYSAFYGLQQEPFRLTPDPRFLHLAEPHRNTLRAMVEGIASRKGLQISVGPIGTGKTTLLYCLQHLLIHEASPQRPVRSAFIVNPTLSADEMFEMLFDELEISGHANTKPARLRALHELLLETHKRNGAVVVIIDEAHLLSPAGGRGPLASKPGQLSGKRSASNPLRAARALAFADEARTDSIEAAHLRGF